MRHVWAVTCALLMGCGFESPEAPTFQTHINIPFPLRTTTIEELVEESEGIVVDSSQIRVSLDGEIDPVLIDDRLAVSVRGLSVSSAVGEFRLEDDLDASVHFSYADLAPGFPTGHVTIPAFAFDVPEREVSGLDEFSQVTVASAELVVEVTNELPIPISGPGVPPPGFEIVVRAGRGDEIVADWTHPGLINPGQTVQTTALLADLRLTNELTVAIAGASEGSGGIPVDISADQGLRVVVRLENVAARSATAEVPEQRFGEDGTSDWGEGLQVQEAQVAAGQAEITVRNDTPLDAIVRVRFPDFSVQGDTLGFDLALPGGSADTHLLDFTGGRFQRSVPTNETTCSVRVQTVDTGGEQVDLVASDSVAVDVGAIDLELAWVVGVPTDIDVAFGPYEETMEWPDEIDPFLPAMASLTFAIQNEIGADVAGPVRIVAHAGTDSAAITEPIFVAAGALGSPVPTEIILDESNSDILELLALHPTRLTVSGDLRLAEGETVRLDRSAALAGGYRMEAPFAFEVIGGTVRPEVGRIDLDADAREEIERRVGGVTLIATLSNGFPFGATATLLFSEDSTAVFDAPETTLDPVAAPAARVDEISGKPVEESESVRSITLSDDAIDLLTRPEVFVGVLLDIEPTGRVVVVSPGTEVGIRGVLRVEVTIDED